MTSLYIDDQAALADVCRRLRGSVFVALDTEFIRERTYYPQLCLIQIANEELVACIDPLALRDLEPLRELLFDTATTKVLHAARQDMEIFYHLWGELPQPVFDTQVAAALLGAGEQIGYAALVKETLGVELEKSQSRTDWMKRPLSDKQIRYAADDVRYLVQIYIHQLAQLENLGRRDWLRSDFIALSDADCYRPDPENSWRKIKGASRLHGAQLAILHELAAWRERLAMDRDRPRRHIVADEVLSDIARLQPEKAAALSVLRGVQHGFIDAHGEAIVACVQAARQSPREQWPKVPSRKRLTMDDEAMVDALMAVLKLCAAEQGISPNSLCNRKELEQLVLGEQDLPVLKGWRREHAGARLQAFLSGDGALGAWQGRLRLDAG